MKKDIEWLRREVKKLEDKANNRNQFGSEYTDEEVALEDVKKLIDQLDEPEVLSQEWIDRNKFEVNGWNEAVHVEDLQKLLVPKHPTVEVQELINKYSIDTMSTYDVKVERERFVKDLQNLLVPKQEELEAKIQELIEAYKQEEDAYSNPENGWIGGFIEDLKNLVEEQKYIVSDNSSIPLLIKNDSGEIVSYDSQIAYNNSNGTIELTEQEIKDYDERYWAFAEPVEEVEE